MRLSSPLGWLSDAIEFRRLRRRHPMRTGRGRALPVSSGQSLMPSTWCDYAAWRANESSCVTRQNAPAGPATSRSSDGQFSRRRQAIGADATEMRGRRREAGGASPGHCRGASPPRRNQEVLYRPRLIWVNAGNRGYDGRLV
jgi:hypothetical protein